MNTALIPGETYSEEQVEEAVLSGSCMLSAPDLGEVQTDTRRTALHVLAEKGLLVRISGGVSAPVLAVTFDEDDATALHVAAEHGHLDQITPRVTLSQLANCRGGSHWHSALRCAFASGHVGQADTSETAAQLCKQVYAFDPPLVEVAELGLFAFVSGGVTAADLKKARGDEGWSGLHAAAHGGHLDKINGGVTCKDLSSVRWQQTGWTALHEAASRGHLHQTQDQVTATILISTKDSTGFTALHAAAETSHICKLQNVSISDMIATKTKDGLSALGLALEHLDPKDYGRIPGFNPSRVPEDVLFSDSAIHRGLCLLDVLLLKKDLPSGFVCAEWLTWAERREQAVWQGKWLHPSEMLRFIRNVTPELMVNHLGGCTNSRALLW
jgi:hypothetical protein